MEIRFENNTLIISGIDGFDLAKSCACGQAFRWKENSDGSWQSVLHSRPVKVKQNGSILSVYPCREGDEQLFIDYFDLERNYAPIVDFVTCDSTLCVCMPCASGIRVFNQEPFEALISFIISANNNIKRISGIVERLCRLAGEELELDGETLYAFPKPERIAALTVEELKDIGAGYRAPYIKASAQRIVDGYDLEPLRNISLDEARKELLTFLGVGPKVADCILLFSLGHTDAFPVDVWIGRAMKELYFDSEPPTKAALNKVIENIGHYSGIVQQYIFYYVRSIGLGK